MSIFAVGDLHLSSFPGIEKPMSVFGERWNDHEKRIEDDWKRRVGEEDTVIIAGDISWGMKFDEALPDLEFIHSLPGKKVLIKGNHDLWWNGINRLNSLYQDVYFLQNKCYSTEGISICGTRGWTCPGSEGYDEADKKIYQRELLRLKSSLDDASCDEVIGVMHFPPTNDKMQPSGFTNLFAEYNVKTVLYGHLHGTEAWRKGIKGYFCGADYRLISLDYLDCKLELIRK